jgi:hypothetical protein
MFTFGSATPATIPSCGWSCHDGGIQRPLYRSAAAYAKSSRSAKSFGGVVLAFPPFAQPGVNRIEKTSWMLFVCAYLTSRS